MGTGGRVVAREEDEDEEERDHPNRWEWVVEAYELAAECEEHYLDHRAQIELLTGFAQRRGSGGGWTG